MSLKPFMLPLKVVFLLLTITVGAEFFGTGAQHIITIPIQEISYPELKKDLENIMGKSMLKLETIPLKLAQKVKGYIIRNKTDDFSLY